MAKPKAHIVFESDAPPSDVEATVLPDHVEATVAPDVHEQLDEDEQEFRKLRRDLPGVKGASAAGIVSISVGKTPPKNEFFRTSRDFRAIMPVVDLEVGMEKQFFVVTGELVEPLSGIGITVADHALYLTVTSRGAIRVIPVRRANGDGEQNEYARTKEMGLVQGFDEWVRLYTDQENRCYKVFAAPVGRFSEPQWPDLKELKIFGSRSATRAGSSTAPSIRSSRNGPLVTLIDLLSLYDEVVLADFEFVSIPGEHPDVVCVAWHELRSELAGSLYCCDARFRNDIRFSAGIGGHGDVAIR